MLNWYNKNDTLKMIQKEERKKDEMVLIPGILVMANQRRLYVIKVPI